MENFREQLQSYQKQVEKVAEDQLSKLRGKAEKKIINTERRLEDIAVDSLEFEEEISDESNVMDKYSQRIYEEIQSTIEIIEKPERINLINIRNYAETARRALSNQDSVLIKYVKLLKKNKYKSRIKRLDKSLKRLNKDLKDLENFIKRDYAPNSRIERAPELINETYEMLEDFIEKYNKLMEHEDEVLEKDEKIVELKKELKEIKNHPAKLEYQRLIDEYETTQREIDRTFSNVKKVFRKYDKLLSTSDIDTNLMSDLVTDAASTMAELKSTQGVRTILEKVYQALEDTAMNLSKEKRENAKRDIEDFLDGGLDHFNTKATNIKLAKERQRDKLVKMDLEGKVERKEGELAAAIRDRNRIYQRELRAIEQLRSEIQRHTEDIEKLLRRDLGIEIKLDADILELPEWVHKRE